MPRAKKVVTAVETEKVKTARKAYPSREERVDMNNAKIARMEALVASRKALLEEAEAKCQSRREALERNEAQLAKLLERKDKLAQPAKARPVGVRAAKAAEKAEAEALLEAIKASGKSLEDVLATLQ